MGELINLNPPAPIAETDIPAAIARDEEVALLLLKSLVLFPRTGTVPTVDANTAMSTSAGGFQWVDGGTNRLNFPASFTSGRLFKVDPLWGTNAASLYGFQIFVGDAGAGLPTPLYVRHHTNGTWSAWKAL